MQPVCSRRRVFPSLLVMLLLHLPSPLSLSLSLLSLSLSLSLLSTSTLCVPSLHSVLSERRVSNFKVVHGGGREQGESGASCRCAVGPRTLLHYFGPRVGGRGGAGLLCGLSVVSGGVRPIVGARPSPSFGLPQWIFRLGALRPPRLAAILGRSVWCRLCV
mgnify:CR=1 FL=1